MQASCSGCIHPHSLRKWLIIKEKEWSERRDSKVPGKMGFLRKYASPCGLVRGARNAHLHGFAQIPKFAEPT